MGNKCKHCGKFLATTDGVKCLKCASRYHRVCLNISPDTKTHGKWICRDCKSSPKLCTPVQAPSHHPEDAVDDTFVDANLGEDTTAALLQEIRLLRKDMASVSREMTFFREEVSRLNSTMSEFNSRLTTVESRISALEKDDINNQSHIEESTKAEISSLRMQMNDREQEYLATDFELAGILEKPGENVNSIVLLSARKVGIDLTEQDIVSAERSGPRRSVAADGERMRPRAIAVRVTRRSLRDDLLRAARVRRSVDTSGVIDGEPRRFFINERLTPYNRYLLFRAKEEGSLGTHHDEFMLAINRHDVDIMALNETWLREGEEGRAPNIPGYRLRHKPRPAEVRGRGGGVGYYIRRGITARTLIQPSTSPDIEQMWLSVSVGGKKLVIGTAYRPPWLNPFKFFEGLTEMFTTLPVHDHVVLVGDFNINFYESDNYCTRTLCEFLMYTNLKQIVNKPTHFTAHSETLIDLVCVDGNTSEVWVDYIHELSSHAFLSFEFNIRKYKPKPLRKSYRKISSINENDLKNYLTNFNQQCLNIYDVNSLVSQFNSMLLSVFDSLAPQLCGLFKESQYPWITYNINEMIRTRNEAHIRSRHTQKDTHIAYYKDLKSEVELAIHREKGAYFTQFINNNAKRPKFMWKHLKNILAYKKKRDTTCLPDHLSEPNNFNRFFLTLPGNSDVASSDIHYYTKNRHFSNCFVLKQI
ncbi:unnamed protein product [Danaus chrysippus]|uniref:(African queen) hypothetical protein n=1 Tax=Danaus chrysippus TaxID=151541 RepID=A0A8J2QYQ6_9NEOP|nr:unnamed protein product [Danaus chrysippus]